MDAPEPPGSDDDPLAGVLERLLARDRGDRDPARERPATGAQAIEGALRAPGRRMIVVAGCGEDAGASALRWAAQWALLIGRRAAVADFFLGDAEHDALSGHDASAAQPGIARVRLPCEPERLRREPGETIVALYEALRRHEAGADLLLLRIPARVRATLLRAVLLAGAVVLPVDASVAGLHGSLEVARDVQKNLLDVRLWPFAETPRALGRFLDKLAQLGGSYPDPFDPGRLDLARALDGLPEAPEEGFLVGALAPPPADWPADLLCFDALRL